MKQTDLKMIKEISKMLFTAVPIKADERFGFLLRHPFASNTLVSISKDIDLRAYKQAIESILVTGRDRYMNLSKLNTEYLEDLRNSFLKNNIVDITIPEGAEAFKQHTFNLIDSAKSIDDILILINKPWYMTFIKYTEAYMSPSDLGRILGDCWVMQEYPNRDSNASIYDIIEWFKKADKKTLMNEEEYRKFKNLTLVPWSCDTLLTVYRGVNYNGLPEGLSWTTDKNKAIWFANRFKGNNPRVYKLDIDISKDADSILAYFSSRNEQEVVIDTSKLNNWTLIN